MSSRKRGFSLSRVGFAAFFVDAPFHLKILNGMIGIRWSHNTGRFFRQMGRPPNYVRPLAHTDKMQWRKLYDRNPWFPVFCDKLAARDFAKERDSSITFPELLWAGSNPRAIPWETLAPPFVVKANHGSGMVIVVKDRGQVDREQICECCERWMRSSFGLSLGEWGYAGIKPKVIIERYLSPPSHLDQVTNYKFFVYDGTVRLTQVESAHSGRHFLTFLARDGSLVPIRKWVALVNGERPGPDRTVEIPKCYAALVETAEKLAGGIDFLRVDLYAVGGRACLSELTCYDGSGLSYFYDEAESFNVRPSERLNYQFGDFWNLSQKNTFLGLAKGLLPTWMNR